MLSYFVVMGQQYLICFAYMKLKKTIKMRDEMRVEIEDEDESKQEGGKDNLASIKQN